MDAKRESPFDFSRDAAVEGGAALPQAANVRENGRERAEVNPFHLSVVLRARGRFYCMDTAQNRPLTPNEIVGPGI